jgi:hypothetical protein
LAPAIVTPRTPECDPVGSHLGSAEQVEPSGDHKDQRHNSPRVDLPGSASVGRESNVQSQRDQTPSETTTTGRRLLTISTSTQAKHTPPTRYTRWVLPALGKQRLVAIRCTPTKASDRIADERDGRLTQASDTDHSGLKATEATRDWSDVSSGSTRRYAFPQRHNRRQRG